MGQVFRAYDTATDRTVAIKLLPAHLAEDREFQQRFRREARTAAALNDPHVVPIHGYGEIDGRLYVDMRLIEGRDLVKYIAENGGRLSPTRAVAVVEQVAAALESAHHAGLVHRDVKPSNILVAAARDFVYLIDFGIARANTDTALTQTGHTMGTMAYMAPERFSGTTDPRADVYSLACVLHECLTGLRPYPGDSFEEQLKGHLNSPAPQPSTIAPGLTAFDAVIARGMAKDPQHRYQTAMQLADAAKAALATMPPTPAEAPTQHAQVQPALSAVELQRRQAKKARRRSTLAFVGGSIALLVMLAVLVTTMVIRDHKAANRVTSRAPASSKVSETTAAAEPTPSATTSTPGVPPLPAFVAPANLGANCQYPASADPAGKPVKPPRSGKVPTDPAEVSVTMATNQGDIGMQLANGKSPCTVNSFVSLAQQGFFDNTHCHRLTTSQSLTVLQCGDPKNNGTGGPGYEFANEYPTDQYSADDAALNQPVLYPRGTLAMANAGPNTNGSQFFLVYDDSELPPEYTAFGTIDDTGLAIIDKVAKGGVIGGGDDGTPVTTVTITSVRLD
jgi:serine/threonine protein kinase/cyclophilin family peptidyl-prolyl cis-trans isomerase